MRKLFRQGFAVLAAMLLALSAFASAEGGVLLFDEDAGAVKGWNSEETLLLEWGDDGAPAGEDAPDSVSLTELMPGALGVSEAPQAESAVAADAQDEASEAEGAIDLKGEYKGKTQTKVYDGTADLTKNGQSLLSPGFKKDDFKLTGISKDYPNVELSTIKVLQPFSGADAGKYNLKFTFTLTGDDASHYNAPTVTVPAEITKRLVTVIPKEGQNKLYGQADPTSLPLNATVRNLVPEHYTVTGGLTREKGEDVGTYKILIGTLDFGNKNYEVTLKDEVFTIDPMPINSSYVGLAVIGNQSYTGKPIEPEITLRYGNYELKKDTDYTVKYSNNTKVGTAKVEIEGKGNFTGSRSSTFTILDGRIDVEDVKISAIGNQTYTGKAVKPKVTLKDGKYTLKSDEDYSLVYKNNKAIGTAKVIVKGKGKYKGKRIETFDIVPKGTTLKRLSGQRKAIKVTWNKQTKGVMGYQIEYDTYRNFADSDKVRVKGSNSTQTTLKRLIANTKYYVRIRTYYKRNGKTYCSAWSKAMTVRTK